MSISDNDKIDIIKKGYDVNLAIKLMNSMCSKNLFKNKKPIKEYDDMRMFNGE